MYESLILVDPEAQLSMEALVSELQRFYSKTVEAAPELQVSEDKLVLAWPEYHLTVHRSAAPHVLVESRWLSEEFAAGHSERDRIAACSVRFEISGPHDPDMDYFNDYLFVGEAAERVAKVFRFEQASGEFV